MNYGATLLPGGGVQFRVWAPNVRTLAVKLDGRTIPMAREGEDFQILVSDAQPGQNYSLLLDNDKERPDPVSRYQPQGVHGPSQIVDPNSFIWGDTAWKGLPLDQYILYELHTGTFTAQGKFRAIIDRIPYLKDLGVTAIELMPIAEFPGSRNWGYDGVDYYAPHSAYGGPDGLKELVNACHRAGLAVVLDVVYNHVGPEGNYLGDFGPYFTDNYRTPWGSAMNFDGPGSDGVRRFVIDNALYWLTEYHIDALRLDAIHGIYDFGALHILAELADRFHARAEALGRQAWLIAESDLNDVRVIQSRAIGGWGMDAQWHDEFHHTLVSYLTSPNRGFLTSFGTLADVQKVMTEGFVYDGVYSPWRRRRFGSSSKDMPGRQFVVFIQNHDQIANTCQGARLSQLVSIEQYKLAAVLLFMGDEFASPTPFLYFTSHLEESLGRAVTEGRKKEFADFASAEDFSDPQSSETFLKSKIDWHVLKEQPHREVLQLYRQLIALRKTWPCLANCRKDLTRIEVDETAKVVRMERSDAAGTRALLICNFAATDATTNISETPALRTSTANKGVIAARSAALYLSRHDFRSLASNVK